MKELTKWFLALTTCLCLAWQAMGQPGQTNSPNRVAQLTVQPARPGERVNLQGLARSKDGKPLEGVLVRITAVREVNTGEWLDDESAPEVGNQTNTAEDGTFSLPSLPVNRVYRLLAATDGFKPFLYRNADPTQEPVEIRLEPTNGRASTGKFSVHGRIQGPEERPVIFATVEPDGIATGLSTSWGGRQPGFPELAVSDTNGEFVFSRDEPFTRLQVRIRAPGLASTQVWMDVTNTVETIEMGVGATIRGRVLKDGKPLAKLRVGVSGSDRSATVYAGRYLTTTGEDGTFVFKRLPPDTSWYLYGDLKSFKSYGALPPRLAASAGHGQVTDLGDLEVVPGLRLAGKVQTRHGEPLPKPLNVYLSYESSGESENIRVDDEGEFSVDGLFKGAIAISLGQNDWHLSGVNRSLDTVNSGYRMTGLLEEDKTNLLVVIEKGQTKSLYGGTGNGYLPQPDWPDNRPLAGAEHSDGPMILVAGTLVDDKTEQPVAQARMVPGRRPPGFSTPVPTPKPLLQQMLSPLVKKPVPFTQKPFMEYAKEESISNGNFSVEFAVLTSQPMLMVEAEGYQAMETEAITQTTTNLVIRLKRGTGPNGVVLLPNGKPAEKATVTYGARQEQGGLGGRVLTWYAGRGEGERHTGIDGKFSFPARAEGVTLFIAHPDGWAEEQVEKGGDGLEIKLKPWASVTGTLVDSNGVPKAGVSLCVTMMNNWQNGGGALVNLQLQTNTDAQGHFFFHDVPPGRLELQRMVPPPGTAGFSGGYSWQLQTPFEAEPGITNDIGKVTYDTPPPPSMLEQMKKRLGL